MSKAKRYFWLKLKEDFFKQKEIKLLRKVAGGDTFTIIYLELLLLSLKNDGKIYFDGLTDNFAEEIALELDESEENVKLTLAFLENKGLIGYSDQNLDEFELTNIASMIGSESEKAALMRRKRARDKEQPKVKSGNNVTKELPNRYTEKEKELEQEKEKELQLQKKRELSQEKSSGSSRPVSFDTYELSYGVLNPLMMDQLYKWMDDFGEEGDAIVNEALIVGMNASKTYYSYVNGVLKNWYYKKLRTLQDVKAYLNKWETDNFNRNQYKEVKQQQKSNSYEKTPEFVDNIATEKQQKPKTSVDIEKEKALRDKINSFRNNDTAKEENDENFIQEKKALEEELKTFWRD